MAVPSSLTDQYDALLSTTLRNWLDGRMRDNITRGNKYLAWLESRGRFDDQDGGERVRIPLMHALNNTADIYSGYGLLDVTPQNGITTAFYEWTQLAVTVSISRKEERQNSGRHAILSLLRGKTLQAEASLRELLNNCVVSGRITSGASSANGEFSARVGNLDSGASGPLPLTAIIDATANRSRTDMGNINPNTHAFWQNQSTESTATTFAGLKQEMLNIYNNCSKGVGGSPDFMLGDQVAWEQYFNALQSQERYINTSMPDVLRGTQNIMFMNATFIWDEVVPDVATNADIVDSIGTVALSNIHYVNSESMVWVRDSQTNFINTPFIRRQNQDARASQILWMGAMGTNNRRKNGVLKGISQSITS